MTGPSAAHLPRRSRAVLALLLAVLAGVWGHPQVLPAAAHDALLDIDPADSSTSDVAPTQVVLTFSSEQLALGTGAAVSVTDAAGGEWAEGSAVVSGATVTQPLRAGQPPGPYTVRWRSVASDGHPVSGASSYEVAATAEGSTPSDGTAGAVASPGVGASAEPTGSASPSSAESPVGGRSQAATQADPGAGDQEPQGSQVLPLAAAGAAAVAVALAALLAARRREDRT